MEKTEDVICRCSIDRFRFLPSPEWRFWPREAFCAICSPDRAWNTGQRGGRGVLRCLGHLDRKIIFLITPAKIKVKISSNSIYHFCFKQQNITMISCYKSLKIEKKTLDTQNNPLKIIFSYFSFHGWRMLSHYSAKKYVNWWNMWYLIKVWYFLSMCIQCRIVFLWNKYILWKFDILCDIWYYEKRLSWQESHCKNANRKRVDVFTFVSHRTLLDTVDRGKWQVTEKSFQAPGQMDCC